MPILNKPMHSLRRSRLVQWIIVGLVVLGVGAACFAAVLMTTIRASAMAAVTTVTDPQVTILVAAEDLPERSVIGAESVTEKTVAKSGAPESYLSEPSQVIGRRLTMPVVEGQAYANNLLMAQGTGPSLAGRLNSGMRAISIALEFSSGLEGLLYPGCIVDILATFNLSYQKKEIGQAVSTTLLENIEVLAVEDQTVVSPPREDDHAGSKQRQGQRSLLVTVLVNPQQAEALQLATGHGRVSLAMRNPEDTLPVDDKVTLLNEGRLAEVADVLGPTVDDDDSSEEPYQDLLDHKTGEATVEEQVILPVEPSTSDSAPIPQWDVDIIRGTDLETRSFPVSGSESGEDF